MASVNTTLLIEGLKNYFANGKLLELIARFNDGGVLNKLTTAVAIAMEGVKVVELLVLDIAEIDAVEGREKRDALVKFLDDAIDVPWYLESVDGPIIGIVIDATVAFLNAFFQTHDWVKKIKEFLL